MPIGGPNGPAQVQVYTNRTAVRFAVSSLDRDLIRTYGYLGMWSLIIFG